MASTLNTVNPTISSPTVSPSPATSSPQINSLDLECKKICVVRCLYAVICSVAMQYILLALFLLFVNFSLLHPLLWITSTFWLIFSIYTWLWTMPLISSVIIYGIYLGKAYLNDQRVYRTRFMTIYKQSIPKSLFLLLHLAIGFLTTWLYSKFLSTDYQSFVLSESECVSDDYEWIADNVCLNQKYLLLSLYGASVAIWYCWKKDPSLEPCEFPIIHQSKYLRVRGFLYSVLWRSLLRAVVPVATSFVVYSFIGKILLQWSLSKLLNYSFILNSNVHVYDIKLILIIWILSAHILSNLHLMAFLFQVFLTEPKVFPIEIGTQNASNSNYFAQSKTTSTAHDVTLVQALANTNVPIVRQLAALDLYTLANFCDLYCRRSQIYMLSIPGGHPYNWNSLSAQCISLINAYNDELATSIKNIKNTPVHTKYNNNHLSNQGQYMKSFSSNLLTTPSTEFRSSTPTTATEMAEKVRNRQYNESCGIRNMLSPTVNGNNNEQLLSPIKPVPDPCAHFNQTVDMIQQRIQAVKIAILKLPGVNYLFGTSETAQLRALLTISKAEEIGWIVQGLSSLAVHSLHEDRYGVVQINLPEIISTLLQLRETINNIPSISSLGTSSISPYIRSHQTKPNGAIVIRNAVKRSLYNICITFDEYLPDLVGDPSDLRILQNYIEFLEV